LSKEKALGRPINGLVIGYLIESGEWLYGKCSQGSDTLSGVPNVVSIRVYLV